MESILMFESGQVGVESTELKWAVGHLRDMRLAHGLVQMEDTNGR